MKNKEILLKEAREKYESLSEKKTSIRIFVNYIEIFLKIKNKG